MFIEILEQPAGFGGAFERRGGPLWSCGLFGVLVYSWKSTAQLQNRLLPGWDLRFDFYGFSH